MRSAPAGFLMGWVGVALICEAVRWGYGLGITPRLGVEWGTPLWWFEFTLYVCAIGFAEAFCQSRLLRRFRRPVPRWTGVVGAGVAALAVLTALAHFAFMQTGGVTLDAWMFVASGVSEEAVWALATGGIMGFAVWGRRWEGPWMLWITARTGIALGVGIVVALVPFMTCMTGVRVDHTLVQPLQAGVRVFAAGLATAWLLWRFVLPHPPGAPAGAEA